MQIIIRYAGQRGKIDERKMNHTEYSTVNYYYNLHMKPILSGMYEYCTLRYFYIIYYYYLVYVERQIMLGHHPEHVQSTEKREWFARY